MYIVSNSLVGMSVISDTNFIDKSLFNNFSAVSTLFFSMPFFIPFFLQLQIWTDQILLIISILSLSILLNFIRVSLFSINLSTNSQVMPNTNSDLWCIDFINLFSVCTVFSSCFSIVHSKLINGDNARFINSVWFIFWLFFILFSIIFIASSPSLFFRDITSILKLQLLLIL